LREKGKCPYREWFARIGIVERRSRRIRRPVGAPRGYGCAYDAAYLCLAELHGADFLSLDEDLKATAREIGIHVAAF
jgi:hypothetical protein